MSERRAHYRVTSRGMRVTLTHGDDEWTGSVGDTSAAGASVMFATEGAPALPLGARLQLTFSGGPLPAPVSVGAVLRARSEGDFRRYGFAFDDPGRFGRGVPQQAWGTFNRREWVRVAPDRVVPVRVEVLDGPSTGTLLEGQLADLSRGGLAVLLHEGAEAPLGDALRIRCTLRPAGADHEETWTCSIRNRQLSGSQVRYGVAFELAGDEQAHEPPPAYEPFWDCGRCDTLRLLAQTHVHCPSCGGVPRHDHTYFPSWDEVVTAADHPFSGTERTCPACRATWAGPAHYCGRCGTALRAGA